MAKKAIAGASAVGALAVIGAGSLLAARHKVRKSCREFYKAARKEMAQPGLKEGFDPQDMFYVESGDVWLFSGYHVGFGSRKPSPIYRMDAAGNVAKLTVKLPDGEIYKGHGAAVCATDTHAFLTVKDGYVVMSLSDVLEAEDGDCVKAFAHVPVELEPAFMNIKDGVLYIGEFYHARFYDTPPSHWIECPDGTTNPALMYAYDASDSAASIFGFSPRPNRVYSIPLEIQGMCVAPGNRIVLSQSWGYGDSRLLVYELGSAAKQDVASEDAPTYLVAGEGAPLHYLCSSTLQKAIAVPPMAEGIDEHDGRVWLANESASNLYALGKINGGKYVYSIEV